MPIAILETRVAGHWESLDASWFRPGLSGLVRKGALQDEGIAADPGGWDFAGNSVNNGPRWGKPGETMARVIRGSSPV